MTADPLDLMLSPRETLRVLDYIGRNPKAHADKGTVDLGISRHSWYGAIDRLEALHLVVVDRYPGGRKVRAITLTPQGRGTIPLLQGLRELAKGSPLVLEAELDAAPPPTGSAEAGEALLRLAEFAERRGDFALLERVARRAEALERPGEAEFARGLAAFTGGDMDSAARRFETAIETLKPERGGPSYRRALYYLALTQTYLGDEREGYIQLTRLRKLAMDSRDHATEADARLMIGNLKSNRGQHHDAVTQMEKALACARRAGLPSKEAKVLTSLCLTEFYLDEETGLPRSDEALVAARKVGAKVLLVHIHNNRALFFAVRGARTEALVELKAARRLAAETGYERGRDTFDKWQRLVRRILRPHRPAYQLDWRGLFQSLLQTQQLHRPEAPRE